MDENQYNLADLLQGMAGAIASRPVEIGSTTTTRPTEYSDMLARRNQIGQSRGALTEALKQREKFVPMLGNALARTPQTQGYGSWLGAGLAGLGQGLSLRSDLAAERAMKDYETSRADLADALMYDKAMGATQQVTKQIDYAPDVKAKGKSGDEGGGIGDKIISSGFGNIKLHDLNVAAGKFATNKFDPESPDQGWFNKQAIKALGGEDYGVALSNERKNAQAFERFQTAAMDAAFDVLKYLRPATDTDVKVALRKAGASPTMSVRARDEAVTNVLNKELSKAGLPLVRNLQDWDNFVTKLAGTPASQGMFFNGGRASAMPAQQKTQSQDTSALLQKYGAKAL